MNKTLEQCLENIVGKEHVLSDRSAIENYLIDETPKLIRPRPASSLILVKPCSAEEISKILKMANCMKVPVFPRGGGTGLVGGSVPTENGIILSLERMDDVEIDKDNLMAVAEAGVTLEKLLNVAESAGLFFPPHPGDEGAHLGGLAATNAGGSRAVRYGVMRNYIRAMEIVLPTGEIIELGGKTLKNNVSYALIDLMIGSEGTLGVITKVTLRLFAKPTASATLIVPYNSRRDAAKSALQILQQGIMPLAIEYVERELMERTAEQIGEVWRVKEGYYYLLIVVTEHDENIVVSECAKIADICKENNCLEPLYVDSKREQNRILNIRSKIYSALKAETADILDLVVPPANLGKLMDKIDEIAEKHKVYLPLYGHAADGNLHVHIIKQKENKCTLKHVEKLRNEIYGACLELGGVITGEHGIGKVRTKTLHKYLSEKEIELIKNIKKIFDPNNILNPGTKTPLANTLNR